MSVNRGARTRASRPTGLQVARHRDEQVQHRHHPPTSEGGVDLEIASSRRETIPMKDAAAGNLPGLRVLKYPGVHSPDRVLPLEDDPLVITVYRGDE